MRRREFIAGLGSAVAAWPVTTRAQPPVAVIGYLGLTSAEADRLTLEALRKGLSETGYVEGRNLRIEYRGASGDFERLPALAVDLVSQRVQVIITAGLHGVRAAQAATATVPIVFSMGEDPVKEGLVANLNRPGGNTTGVVSLGNQLIGKRLQFLHEIVSPLAPFAFLVNRSNPNVPPDTQDARLAAEALGRPLHVLTAASVADFEPAFAAMARLGIGGLSVHVDPFFRTQRERIVAMSAQHSIPAIYEMSEFVAAGGLMAYGTDSMEVRRQTGIYVGRILKGERPGDLPVLQATKFELEINLKTARTLSLTIPPGVLSIADRVVE